MDTGVRRNYMVLIAIDKPAPALANIPDQLSKVCVERPKLIWTTSSTIGFGATSTHRPIDLIDAMADALNRAKAKDALIVELGDAWFSRLETNLAGWLHTHLHQGK